MDNEAKTPLVSVILPVYNSEKYIEKTLISIFNQTYTNFEIIVIDDGSIDNSRKIVEQYLDKISYYFQLNTGVSSARNKGIKHSRGELIAFIDSDDMWYPQKLEHQVNVYLKEPQVSIIYTECDKAKNFNGYLPIEKAKTEAVKVEFIDIFKMPYLKPTTVMVPMKTIEKFGVFDTNLPTAEDVDFFLRCSYGEIVLYIPQVLVFMLDDDDSLGNSMRSYTDNINVVNDFINKHPDFYSNNKKLVSDVISNIYIDFSNELCFKSACLPAINTAFKSMQYQFNYKAIKLIFKSLIKLLLKPLSSIK